jgi:fluoroquinolone resistance protein
VPRNPPFIVAATVIRTIKDKKLRENELFEKTDFTVTLLPKGEYEDCTFRNCHFYTVDLSNYIFRNCVFDGCDFSLAKLKNTALNDIKFANCKLLGVQFSECRDFLLSFGFENCLLRLAVFYKLKLRKTSFRNCNLQEADFTETDLAGSAFENCDLQRAVFDHTNLEKADFRSSFNYSINPEINRIRKARFSLTGVAGLLDKYDIEIE